MKLTRFGIVVAGAIAALLVASGLYAAANWPLTVRGPGTGAANASLDTAQVVTLRDGVGINGTVPVSESGTWNVGLTGSLPPFASTPTVNAIQSGTYSIVFSVAQPVTLQSTTSGGAQSFFNDAVAGTVQQIKTGIGQLYSLSLLNTTAATAYLQVFCKPSASVTIGSTVADMVLRLPASPTVPVEKTFPVGWVATSCTGLSVAGTTTAAGSTGAAVSVTAGFR